MRYFQDTGLLILYSFPALFFIDPDIHFIIALLCSLILMCCCYVFENRIFLSILFLIYGLLTLLMPRLLLFCPVFIYVILYQHLWLFLLWAAGIYFYLFIPFISVPSSVRTLPDICLYAGLFGILLAVLLQRNTEKYEKLTLDFRHSRDDSEELNLLLAEKNHALLEKQNYEIYNATLKERNRIAREIHDNVGHVLSRSILLTGAVKAVNKDNGLTPLLDNLETSLNSAMNSIRSSVHDLHDEAVNLEHATQSLIQGFTFCPVTFTYDISGQVPRNVKYCFISIVKESLANIMKHSNATSVKILLREHPALYQLCIEDNGTEISHHVSRLPDSFSSGIGLMNMKERVDSLNGSLQISTKDGFRIFITIPKTDILS